MHRNTASDMDVSIEDVTTEYAQLNIQGPRSRELLAAVTAADLSNDAFPFRTAREIDIGATNVMCVRITYVGELGYELYIPSDEAVEVYDTLVEAGRQLAMTAVDEAMDAEGDCKKILDANKEFIKALNELAKGTFDKAIKHYEHAWEKAEKSLL